MSPPSVSAAASIASTGTTTFVLVILLLLLAAVMAGVAVWLIRATRGDPAALAPLEVMGERSWRRAEDERRSKSLAEARPPGAAEPAPMLDYEVEAPESGPAAGSMTDDAAAAIAEADIATGRTRSSPKLS